MSQCVGVSRAKMALQSSAQVSATHITPREHASFSAWPGSTSLSRAISSSGPIRIRVLSSNRRLAKTPVSSACMAVRFLVRSDAGHDTQAGGASQAGEPFAGVLVLWGLPASGDPA
ncbi:hypothetical protein D9M71_474570 [compost metagenome]